LKELLLEIAVYAGVPAANAGFKVVGEQIKENK
jgi:alkylhydroperoxidase/carboxymuconolactone decarboxylase family protein YurZ